MREILRMSLLALLMGAAEIGLQFCGVFLFLWSLFNGQYLLLPSSAKLMIIFVATFPVYPVLQLNPSVRQLVRRQHGEKKPGSLSFDCQITFSPRIYNGLRAVLDDADDVGRLEIETDCLRFTGDHVSVHLPFEAIDRVKRLNGGFRNLWVVGHQIEVASRAFEHVDAIVLFERQSNLLIESRRISREIFALIDAGVRRSLGHGE